MRAARFRLTLRCLLGFALAVLTGCPKDPALPPGAPLDRRDGGLPFGFVIGGGGGGHSDAGPDGGDGGSGAGALELDCVVIDPDDGDPRAAVTFGAGPSSASFDPTGTFVTWDTRGCDRPTLLLGIADGHCSLEDGDLLLFAVDKETAEAELDLGPNLLAESPDDKAFHVELVDQRAGGEFALWGSCAGVSGTVTVDAWGYDAESVLRATFSMTLPECTDFGLEEVTVSGSFDLEIPEDLTDACS